MFLQLSPQPSFSTKNFLTICFIHSLPFSTTTLQLPQSSYFSQYGAQATEYKGPSDCVSGPVNASYLPPPHTWCSFPHDPMFYTVVGARSLARNTTGMGRHTTFQGHQLLPMESCCVSQMKQMPSTFLRLFKYFGNYL